MARTQRDRLIDAMARTVATKGFSAPLTEVCAAAGVSTRAFYEHFSDKEDCFIATFDRGAGLLQRTVTAAYNQPERWQVRIRRGIEVLLHLLAAEPAFANLAIVEMLAAGPRTRERCRRFVMDNFHRFLDDAPKVPDQIAVPGAVREAVVAGVFGLLFDYVSAKRTAELPRLLPEITYFVLSPFMGQRAAVVAAMGTARRNDRPAAAPVDSSPRGERMRPA